MASGLIHLLVAFLLLTQGGSTSSPSSSSSSSSSSKGRTHTTLSNHGTQQHHGSHQNHGSFKDHDNFKDHSSYNDHDNFKHHGNHGNFETHGSHSTDRNFGSSDRDNYGGRMRSQTGPSTDGLPGMSPAAFGSSRNTPFYENQRNDHQHRNDYQSYHRHHSHFHSNRNNPFSTKQLGPARILLLPYPGMNHSDPSSMASLGDEMAGRGHEVYMLVADDYQDMQELNKHYGITPVMYRSGQSGSVRGGDAGPKHRDTSSDSWFFSFGGRSENEEQDRYGWNERRRGRSHQGGYMDDTRYYKAYDQFTRDQAKMWQHACTEALSDHDLMQRLRRMNFDLAIVDGHPVSRCLMVIPYRLGIPYASMVEYPEPWIQGNPHLPSFVPFVYGSTEYSDRMNLWERFLNMWHLYSWSYDTQIDSHREDYLTRFIPDKPARHADDLAKDAVMWFVESDVVLEYPRPNMPNVIEVGGMTAQSGNYKKLPMDIQSFMEQHATRGEAGNVILVDLGRDFSEDGGHRISNMPNDLEDKLRSAFKQTRYQYLWKTSQHPDHYGGDASRKFSESNKIKMVPWWPRNNVLAHPNVRLFITDGSNNAQYEAIYHGVPTLVISGHGGQKYAGRQVMHRGYGLNLDAHSLTSSQLIDAIEEVLHNSTFSHNLQRAARFFRDSRDHKDARERAADWIEKMLTHGAGVTDDYFRSHGQQLNQSAYSMLDVVASLIVGHLVVLWVTYKILAFFCRLLFCGRSRGSRRNRAYFRADDDDDNDDESTYGGRDRSGDRSGDRAGDRPGDRATYYRSGGGRHRKH